METHARRSFYLGRYNCVELLSEGPLGETFRAKIYGVAGFEKQFVVRRIPMAACADEAFVKRLTDAATRYAAIDSERVARVHDVNVQGAQYYIAVDLIRGVDLQALLRAQKEKHERLSSEASLLVALELAESLALLHSRVDLDPLGIRHLGLSPDTVVVTGEGDVRLFDVGLMEALITPGWATHDRHNETLRYLAPEVLRGDGVTAAADIFSIGAILFELLTGEPAFAGETGGALIAAMQAGPPTPKYLDPRSAAIVSRALHPLPAQRFASMDGVVEALRSLLVPRVQRARNDLGAQVRRLLGRPTVRLGSGVTTAAATAGGPSAEKGPSLAALLPNSPFNPDRAGSKLPKPPPPKGPALEPVPPRNTFAGVGAGDPQVSVEMAALPGPLTERALPAFFEESRPPNDLTEPMLRIPAEELLEVDPISDPHALPPALPTPPTGTHLGNPTGPLSILMPEQPHRSDPEPSKEIDIGAVPMPTSAEMAGRAHAPPTVRVAPLQKPRPKRGSLLPWIAIAVVVGAGGGTGLYFATRPPAEAKPPTSSPLPTRAATAETPTTPPARPSDKPVEKPPEKPAEKPPAAVAKPVEKPTPPVAPGGVVAINSAPSGAQVIAGGKLLGRTPLTISAPPGDVTFVAEGFRLLQQPVDGKAPITLVPARLSPGLAGGAGLKVRCGTSGEFRIFVDGEDSGMTCPNETRISVKAGPHKVALVSPLSGARHEADVVVKDGSSSTRLYLKH